MSHYLSIFTQGKSVDKPARSLVIQGSTLQNDINMIRGPEKCLSDKTFVRLDIFLPIYFVTPPVPLHPSTRPP